MPTGYVNHLSVNGASQDFEAERRSSAETLSRQSLAVLNTLLRDLPETWMFRNEADNTWTAFDIVGYLIHAERVDWIPRIKLVVQFGETQFASFDRTGHIRESQGKSLAQLLDEFARLRSEI